MTPILGFAPDAEQTTIGVLSDCDNLAPGLTGMQALPSLVTPDNVPALAGACKGAAVVIRLDGSRRVIAGTASGLYELSNAAWNDVGRGISYTGGADNIWSFAQFGDTTVMSNGVDAMQRSTSGAFADIASAPKAKVVFSVGAFVMALNVNDGTIKPDGWHCCAAYDETDWTESSTTKSGSGRLVSSPGAITAGGRMGEYAVAYKSQSIYIGQYVDAPAVWDWVQVPGGSAGCVGKNAWCDVNGAHFIVGEDNFWMFDGTRPVPIGDGAVRFWFMENVSINHRHKIVCTFDKITNRVYVFFPAGESDQLDSVLIYHVLSKKWGKASMRIQAALEYVSPAITIDGMDTYSATIDGLPAYSFDSPFWSSGSRNMAVFNTSGQMQTLTGTPGSSTMTTGDVGEDGMTVRMQQVGLRYARAPQSASVVTYSAMNSGRSYINGPSGQMNDGKFDVMKVARWHKAKFTFSGAVTVTHMAAKFKHEGTR